MDSTSKRERLPPFAFIPSLNTLESLHQADSSIASFCKGELLAYANSGTAVEGEIFLLNLSDMGIFADGDILWHARPRKEYLPNQASDIPTAQAEIVQRRLHSSPDVGASSMWTTVHSGHGV